MKVYEFKELMELSINELKIIKIEVTENHDKTIQQKQQLIANILYLQNLNKEIISNGK